MGRQENVPESVEIFLFWIDGRRFNSEGDPKEYHL
jgi:hypothetical protein